MCFLTEFGQEATATQALAATMAGDVDSLGRLLSTHTSAKITKVSTSDAAAVVALAHVSGVEHAGFSDDAAASTEDAYEPVAQNAGPGVSGKVNRPTRRNHQEIEELAR